MATWDDLRTLRANGLKPSLPVVVTTDGKRPAWMLEDMGCLVVKHEPGEVFHAELLDGLRVLAFLGSCDRAQAAIRSMSAKGVQPESFEAWCVCQKRLDPMPVTCEVARQWQ